GTPWKVDSSLLKHTDCYIGIQTKIQKADRTSPNAFFIGAADIFNSFGEYISCAVHQAVGESLDGLHVDSEFMKALIASVVERYRANTSLMPRAIIVHRQLNFDDKELDGLVQGLRASGADCPCV